MDNFENKTYYIKDEETIFIPAYAALVVKKLTNLNIKDGLLTLLGTLVLRIATDNVPQSIVEDIKNGVNVRIGETPHTLNTDNDGVTIKQENNLIVFTYRFSSDASFLADVGKLPFDSFTIDFDFELTSRYVDITESDKKSTLKYRFNIHQHQSKNINLSFKKNCDRLAEYRIAYPLCSVELMQESKKNPKTGESYFYYPKIKISFAFIREPWHMLLTVIFPIIMLDLISLVIFATENSLSDRIGNIATLMLALLAYLPTVRSEIPYVPYFTFCDNVIYSCIFINALCLLEAFIVNYVEHEAITIVTAVIAVGIFLTLCFYILVNCIKHLRFKKKWTKIVFVEVKQASNKFHAEEWENSLLRQMRNERASIE